MRGYRVWPAPGPLRRHLSGKLRGWLAGDDLRPPAAGGIMGGMEKRC